MQDYGRNFIGPMTLKKSSGGYVDAKAYSTSNTQTETTQAVIEAAIADIGLDKRTLYISAGTWNITTNLVIPANINLCVESGAFFSFDTGVTMTISGYLEAGIYQIFLNTGVIFSNQKVVYVEWWGGVADNTAVNSGTAFNLAIASIPNGGIIELQIGTYYINTTINLVSDIEFRGYGGTSAAGSALSRTVDGIMIQGLGVSVLDPAFDTDMIYRCIFRGIKFDGYVSGHTADIFNLKACAYFLWDDCLFTNNGRDLYGAELVDPRFHNCYFTRSGNITATRPGIELIVIDDYAATNNVHFIGCIWEANQYTSIKCHGYNSQYNRRNSEINFVNCKFENLSQLAGPVLNFEHTWNINFVNTSIEFSDVANITEVIRFYGCSHIEGNLWLSGVILESGGGKAFDRIITIDTGAGTYMCRANLFLSGSNWSFIDEDAVVNIDLAGTTNENLARWINIKTYGSGINSSVSGTQNAGLNCNKNLTNLEWYTDDIKGSCLQQYTPAGSSADRLQVIKRYLTSDPTTYDEWVFSAVEDTPNDSSFLQWALNDEAVMKLLWDGALQISKGDLYMVAAKGIILTNATGTVRSKITLNAAGTGLNITSYPLT